jgi:DNA-binding response OmpR family regulator
VEECVLREISVHVSSRPAAGVCIKSAGEEKGAMRVQQQEGQEARREAQKPPTFPLSHNATRGRAASTASCEHQLTGYNFDGLAVHRSDAQRVLIVRDLNEGFETVLRFTPLEYAILVPLLEQYGRLVTWEQLSREAFASPHHLPPTDRRLYRHVDHIRSKLSPFGLMIRSVIDHGYILLGEVGDHASTL